MKYIGAHVSSSGGVGETPRRAYEIGAKAFALFTGSSNRWSTKPIPKEQVEKFRNGCEEFDFSPDQILPHDNFLINLGSPDASKLEMSRKSFLEEMQRCMQLGLTKLNFHPGSHLKLCSEEESLLRIAESINITLDKTEGVAAVLENVAGQGTNLGHTFEQLRFIINNVDDKSRVGVCIDTCHAYSAGYDLRTEEGYENVWNLFSEIIGFDKLMGMHLNDDKRELWSRIDRHESIGKGTLGYDFFTKLVNDPRFDGIPMILETPDESLWPEEIAWLYSQIKTP